MKIALLIQRFPGGGAENYVEEIATRLHKKGEDVTVITSENNSDDSKYDFKIIRLLSIIKIGEYNIWRGLEKILNREKFDIVHTNTYGYYHSDKAARLKKKLGYKLVMTSHGFTGMDLHKLKKEKIIDKTSRFDFLREIYDENIGKKTLLLCDHLIALSQYDYNFYKKIGVNESKISIVPPGVSDIFFEKQHYSKQNLEGDPILLSIGQLSWIKNQNMMIKTMSVILHNKPNAHLYLIGPDGGEEDNLQKQSRELGLNEHISFLGVRSSDEVRNYINSVDILLQTSYAEGLSTVLLESIVSQVPFITTDAGGNGYLVEGTNTGLIVNFNDYEKLAEYVLNLLNDEKLIPILSNNGKQYSKMFSWNTVFPRIFQIYINLLN